MNALRGRSWVGGLAFAILASCTCDQPVLPPAGDLAMVDPPDEMIGGSATIEGDRLTVEYEDPAGATYIVVYRIVPVE